MLRREAVQRPLGHEAVLFMAVAAVHDVGRDIGERRATERASFNARALGRSCHGWSVGDPAHSVQAAVDHDDGSGQSVARGEESSLHPRETLDEPVKDLLAFCRLFGMAERDSVCCGDVSVAQCVTLQLLHATPMDSSTLAEQTGVTKGAITRLVEGLDKRGWIKKKADKDDGRRFVLSLNAAGRKKAQALESLTEATVQALFERIPKNKRDQVRESLQLLRAAAERASFSC